MDAAERGALLRARLKAIKERPVSLARPGWMGFPSGAAPFGTSATERHQVGWVRDPDAKPEKELGKRNRRDVSALEKIAAKWRKFM